MQYVAIKEMRVPSIGLGTWELRGSACVEAVLDALEAGYRHIDTAQMYENEEQVGQALTQSDVPRDEVFLTTKIMHEDLAPKDLAHSVDESLERLATDHVDLLLIHWPNPVIPLGETIEAMKQLRDRGKAKHIGVSNFTPSLVAEASEHTHIRCNQVEYHPYLSQSELVTQAQKMGHMLTAYSPLARGRVNDDPTLKDIGVFHGKSPAQVTLRWLIQQDNVAAIPKAGSAEHRRDNLNVFDFELSDDEMNRIHGLADEKRIVDPQWAPAWER